jgi:hypothetical protein
VRDLDPGRSGNKSSCVDIHNTTTPYEADGIHHHHHEYQALFPIFTRRIYCIILSRQFGRCNIITAFLPTDLLFVLSTFPLFVA